MLALEWQSSLDPSTREDGPKGGNPGGPDRRRGLHDDGNDLGRGYGRKSMGAAADNGGDCDGTGRPAAAGELRLRPVHGRDDRALRAVRGPGFSPRLGDFPLAPQLRWCPRSRRYLRAARLSRKHLSINRDPASLVRDGEELDRIGSHIVFVLVLAWAYLAIARRAPNTMNPGR